MSAPILGTAPTPAPLLLWAMQHGSGAFPSTHCIVHHGNPHQPQLHFAIHQNQINRNSGFDVFLTRWELTLTLPLGLTGDLQQLNPGVHRGCPIPSTLCVPMGSELTLPSHSRMHPFPSPCLALSFFN